jgi:hypothetical protein
VIAARVAAKLKELTDAEVETARGGLGELRVAIDGRDVYVTSRLWYPQVGKIVKTVQSQLNGTAS